MPGRVGEKLSNKRINGILAPLRQILNDAADRHGFVSPTAEFTPKTVATPELRTSLVYRVQVRITDNKADLVKRGIRLKPGLVASAEIKTGRRTIARYILDPVLKISDESLREP